MVKKIVNMLNKKSKSSLGFTKTITINSNNNYDVIICKNNYFNKINKKFKDKYVKVVLQNLYNNRDIIVKVTKKQKGGYI